MRENFGFAIVLSALAACSTTLGSVLGMAVRRPSTGFMGFSLGFSAGVMMFVSFAELLATAIGSLGFSAAVIAFFIGVVLMFVIDLVVPHEFISEHTIDVSQECFDHPAAAMGKGWRHRYGKRQEVEPARLLRIGILIALGIGLHNLPEGMATFAGAVKNRSLGIAIAVAIALHNIPEGLAVAVPVFCATGSRRKALVLSTLSGAAELAGAVIAALILMPFLNERLMNLLLAGVGGLMVFISFDELIPGSYAYGHEHLSVAGVISGMMLMAMSLVLFYL
ncbi:MAG: zinc transporter ZupT [candidate division WOR-3 bacterium]